MSLALMLHWIDTHLPLSQFEISFLREQKLFRCLNEDQFNSLLTESKAIKLGRGDKLYSKNQHASHFFVLVEGQIKLTRTSVSGSEKVIDIVKPGQFIAEAVLLTSHQDYSEDAFAIRKARVIAVSASAYFAFLRKSPEFCLELMEVVSEHVHWLVDEIDRITLHDAAYRLISYLLEEIQSDNECITEFQLNTPKTIIASRLSITPETLSRLLKALATQDLIDYHNGGLINLKDVPKLRALLLTEMPRKFYV